jgi:hypothetical protein
MRTVIVCLSLLFAAPLYAQQNLQGEIQVERNKYPATHIGSVQIGEILNTVAARHAHEGWRIMAKSGGNNCAQPQTGTRIACDILLYLPTSHWFDVLRDAEGDGSGTATPQWSDGGVGDMSAAVMPVGGTTPPVIPPVIPPTQPPLDLSGVHVKLDALAVQLAAHDERLRLHAEEASLFMQMITNRYVQIAASVAATYFAQRELSD